MSLPERFGRFHILEEIGRGGMGTVYLAHDTSLERRVALKIPHFGSKDDAKILERFLREARAAAALRHPNLCPVHDAGQIGGVHYLAMAYLEGERLSRYTRPDELLPQRSVAKLVAKVALAVHEAHRLGIIHRDLKPGNVMLTARREPVVMDFGLARQLNKEGARLTQAGDLVGTPAYMAPEQLRGGPDAATPACDIYSLGVILFELLTGRLPFEGPTVAILAQIITEEPFPAPSSYRPDVDRQLEAICRKATAWKAGERYPSMTDMAAALMDNVRRTARSGAALDSGPASRTTEAVRLAEPAANRQQRRRVAYWALVAGALLVGGAAALGLVNRDLLRRGRGRE